MQDLEKELKAAIEDFIISATKATLDPLISFLTKVSFSRHFYIVDPATSMIGFH